MDEEPLSGNAVNKVFIIIIILLLFTCPAILLRHKLHQTLLNVTFAEIKISQHTFLVFYGFFSVMFPQS